MAKEHGNCPSCNKSLSGGLIWEHFFNQFQTTGYWMDENGKYTDTRRILTPAEATEAADAVAKNYGATRTEGRWGHAIGESINDRIAYWHCPFCKHKWKR